MNFEHAMKIFKVMQKRKAQANAREKHRVKKDKIQPQKVDINVTTKKLENPKTSSNKSIKSSSKKKKRKSKKNSKNASKLSGTSKVEEEIEIDIIDV
jgi:predicted  nucleic acid-binding Zn-ribbon protein